MTQSALHIQPEASTTALKQQFVFSGVVDIQAIPELEKLYILPVGCEVEFDFAGVLRVNSMGLAQLLKLFEILSDHSITIRLLHVNRMIAMLFKMTGLARFLADDHSVNSSLNAVEASASVSIAENNSNQTELSIDEMPVISQESVKTEKINMLVHAQSGYQVNGWFFFNTYLQRRLGREIHIEVLHGAAAKEVSPEQMDIVFMPPFAITRLILQHRFLPLMRLEEQTDEVTILVRASDARQQLAEFQGTKVATASADSFVYLLGRFLLDEDGIDSAHLEYQFSGHEVKAVQMLLKEQVDLVFMLSETYQGLSGLTKKMVRELDQSDTGFAFPLLCISPSCKALGGALIKVLSEMGKDAQGQKILQDLGIQGWARPNKEEIQMLLNLYSRYAQRSR